MLALCVVYLHPQEIRSRFFLPAVKPSLCSYVSPAFEHSEFFIMLTGLTYQAARCELIRNANAPESGFYQRGGRK